MKVLLIEPKASLREGLQRRFIEAGMSCDAIDFSDDIGRGSLDYDIVVLNMALDGKAVLQRMRSAGVQIPVLVLSRENAANLRVMALDAGADDFLGMPFYPPELVARVRAIYRRSVGQAANVVRVAGGRLTIDLSRRNVELDGWPVRLSNMQYRLLAALAERKNYALSKAQIMARLYTVEHDEPMDKIIDVYVCKLRQKLGPVVGKCLVTVWGRGYCLTDPENAMKIIRAQGLTLKQQSKPLKAAA
jgi:two-component system cell cycle response regulator CtrA